jgi:hypothetical protein
MTKRATSLRFVEGTQTVGTARVREDRTVGRSFAERELMRRTGEQPASGFDDIAAGGQPVVSLAPSPRATPRQAAKQALQALGRLKAGAMNKTEAAYARYLEDRKHAGDVAWYRFEGVKLRLADSTFYTPDFAVMLAGGEMECHEVKGHWQDDARAKIKIAADQYPFRFIAITAKTKKSGGGWAVEEF